MILTAKEVILRGVAQKEKEKTHAEKLLAKLLALGLSPEEAED